MELNKTDKVIWTETAVCMAFCAALCSVIDARADVFSDAATWHQGFYGSGTMVSGRKDTFPDKLRSGDSANNYHKCTIVGEASGVRLLADTVNYPNPYSPNTVLVSRSETVAYIPQTYAGSIYSNSTIQLTNPFAVTNTASFTFFVRFKWDGTTRKDGIARFLNAGYHWNNSGFLLGVTTAGKLELRANDGATSTSKTCTSGSSMVSSGVWTDCAVVVADSKMTVYTQAAGEAIKSTVMTETFGKRIVPTTYQTYVRLGGEEGKTTETQSVFPGYFHAFASWPRALSEDEVKQVFAYPSTADLVRLGTKNGSSLEFKGATLGGAGSGSATEDWAQIAPSLTNGAPSLSIPFTVPANFAGVAQVLRVAFATNSASEKVNVSVGGTAVGELTAKPGESDLLTVKADLLTSGAKTLTLTRTGSSGDVVFDAIALGGGFQLATKNNSKSDIGAVSGKDDVAVIYYSYCTNSILTNVRDDLPHHNTREYTKQYFHVYVPGEIAGSDECKIVFKSNVKPGVTGHVFALSVNGNEVARKTIEAYSPTWTAFECDVPATYLVPGNNVFIFANVTGGDYAYCNIDYYRLETIYKKRLGFAIILR